MAEFVIRNGVSDEVRPEAGWRWRAQRSPGPSVMLAVSLFGHLVLGAVISRADGQPRSATTGTDMLIEIRDLAESEAASRKAEPSGGAATASPDRPTSEKSAKERRTTTLPPDLTALRRQAAANGYRPDHAMSNRPEVTRPEVTRPEVTRPEVNRPETNRAEEGQTEAGRTEAGQAKAAPTETGSTGGIPMEGNRAHDAALSGSPVVSPVAMPSTTSGVMGSTEGTIRSHYATVLRAAIERQKRYPLLARRRRLEGTVLLRFDVSRDGRLLRLDVTGASRHPILDEAAMNAVQSVGRFPTVPAELPGDRLSVEVPVVFRIDEPGRM